MEGIIGDLKKVDLRFAEAKLKGSHNGKKHLPVSRKMEKERFKLVFADGSFCPVDAKNDDQAEDHAIKILRERFHTTKKKLRDVFVETGVSVLLRGDDHVVYSAVKPRHRMP